MIPISKILNIKRIISHKDCADGVASALIINTVCPNASIEFMQYNTKDHIEMVIEPNMIFCDFSPHASKIQECIDNECIVLDHHRTQESIVKQFKYGFFGDEKKDPGISGAMLAYNEIYSPIIKDKLVQKIAQIIGIRDTWQKDNIMWTDACKLSLVMKFVPYNILFGLNPSSLLNDYKWLGDSLYSKQINDANYCLDNSYRFISNKGTKVIVFESVEATSDACEIDASKSDLIVGFHYNLKEGKIIYSTRSRGIFDCGKMCKSFGGGGHTNAAGFLYPFSCKDINPYVFFQFKLNEYQSA